MRCPIPGGSTGGRVTAHGAVEWNGGPPRGGSGLARQAGARLPSSGLTRGGVARLIGPLDVVRRILPVVRGVSADDRRKMARQAAALRDLETSDAGDETQRVSAIESANLDRRKAGLDELKTEGEFHRKAVALGLIRR